MKKLAKKTIHKGVETSKRALSKNPRLKSSIKRALAPHFKALPGVQNTYDAWVTKNYPDTLDAVRMTREGKNFKYQPLISILVPTYNTNIEFLRDCIDSVLAQAYQNWELCIVDDASPSDEVRYEIKQYATRDERIKYKFLKKNHHIADATNAAAQIASGEFLALFDHDDLLWPNALSEVVKALNKDKNLDFIYSDEDKITENRHEHLGPFFKPDWNPDFLHSVNYITHFSVVRKSLFEKINGFRAEYNGAQDWDLFLRITDETNKIYHINKMLYSWRIHDLSTAKDTGAKPYVVEAQRKAISDDLARKGYEDAKVQQDPTHSGYWRVTYPVKGNPLISIVIPTKNQLPIVKRCIESIYQKTTYKNFEIILVDTGSDDKRIWSWYEKVQKAHSNFKVVKWPEKPFSYARSCNAGADASNGELLVMLNNDTEVITPNWLEMMAGDAQRREVGAVGCLLFFPDKKHIQHAGVGVGLGGVAANSFQMMTLQQPMTQTQHLYINTRHNMTAVTAACLMIRKELFEEIGGFDEEYRVTYNDVDLCLRLHDKGYRNIYTPYARLLHHESISVGLPEEVKKRDTTEMRSAMKQFKKQWSQYIDHDPALNDQLSKMNAMYDIE